MPIELIDGFDYYANITQFLRRWTSDSGATRSLVTGRLGGQAIRHGSVTLSHVSFPSTNAVRVGCAVRFSAIPSDGVRFLQFRNGTSFQCELALTSTGTIGFRRSGTVIGTDTTATLLANTWYYLEWYVVITDSTAANQCNLYINNELFHSLGTGEDTKNLTSNQVNRLYIGSNSTGTNVDIDDLWVSTESTSLPTLLGDTRIVTLYPDNNGAFSDFVGSDSDSIDNYLEVNSTTISESTFVQSSTVNHRDSYSMADLGLSTSAIHAVAINAHLRKEDAGSRTARSFLRIGTTNYETANITPTTSYVCYQNLYLTNPATSSAWTDAAVNGLQAGIKVQA